MSAREHGSYVKYVQDKCRCFPCRVANSRYEAARTRGILYGTWQPYVDAEPARAHVRMLNAAGIGNKTIAKLSGVPHGSMAKLIYGDAKRGLGPSKRLRAKTADAILAVRATPESFAGGQKVPADMTWQRIHSLMALGYSRRWIACQILGRETYAMQIHHHDLIFARTARLVKELYDRIGDTPAPVSPQSGRAKNEARKNGWPVPAAWDDDGHDLGPAPELDIDEVAVERAMAGEPIDLTKDERAEVARRLFAAGSSKNEIARLLHANGAVVTKMLERIGA